MPEPSDVIDGYVYSKPGDDHDGELVQILQRVVNEETLAAFGCSFFIATKDNEVLFAPGHRLSPWFFVDNQGD